MSINPSLVGTLDHRKRICFEKHGNAWKGVTVYAQFQYKQLHLPFFLSSLSATVRVHAVKHCLLFKACIPQMIPFCAACPALWFDAVSCKRMNFTGLPREGRYQAHQPWGVQYSQR